MQKFYSPESSIQNFQYVLIITAISILLSLMLVFYQKRVIAKTNSLVIKADMMHFVSDLYSNSLIFLGSFLIKYTKYFWIDAVLGAMLSIYLIFAIFNLAKISISSLLDFNMIEEQTIIFKILKDNNFSFSKHDITVFFSGAKMTVNIDITPDMVEQKAKIEKIIYKNAHINSGYSCHHCDHEPQANNFIIRFILKN